MARQAMPFPAKVSTKDMCFWERVAVAAGFRLIKDGKQNPGQFNLPPEDVTFYMRKYQWWLDGKPVNTFLTFKYDEREAVDISVSYRDKDAKVSGELMLGQIKEGSNVDLV